MACSWVPMPMPGAVAPQVTLMMREASLGEAAEALLVRSTRSLVNLSKALVVNSGPPVEQTDSPHHQVARLAERLLLWAPQFQLEQLETPALIAPRHYLKPKPHPDPRSSCTVRSDQI